MAAAAAYARANGSLSCYGDDRFSILDDVWEAFHYIEERAEDVADWAVHKIGKVLDPC